MNTLHIIIAVAALATFANARVASRSEEPIDWYDCSEKDDGYYLHPRDCNSLIHCSSGLAFEELCPVCSVDPNRCPEGRLRFSERVQYCVWADEVDCQESPSPKFQ